MGITPKKKRKNDVRSLNPNHSHKLSPNSNRYLSYNHSHNHSQNSSHLKNTFHHRHHFNTHSSKKPFYPPKKLWPNISPLKSNFNPIETIICVSFSLTLPSLTSLSPSVLLVSFSIQTAQNPFGFIKNPLQSLVRLNRGPTKPPRTITVLCGVWGIPCRISLKSLMNLDFIGLNKVANPYLFRGAPGVTTFVLPTGSRTKAVRNFLEKASRAEIMMAELEHPSLKNMLSFCSERVPIYVHPLFYWSLILQYHLDVVGVSRNGRVTTVLGTGSLRHANMPTTSGQYLTVSNVGLKLPNLAFFQCERTERSKKMRALAWWPLKPLNECCCSARGLLSLCWGLSGAEGRL